MSSRDLQRSVRVPALRLRFRAPGLTGGGALAVCAASLIAVALLGQDVSVIARHRVRLGQVSPRQLTNANGSPRVADTIRYAAVWRRVAPALRQWARDPRLDIDPNFVAALLAKESGGDSLAVSAAPALGLAQLTAAADTDLRTMTGSRELAWMRPEVHAWPRAPAVHDSLASAREIDSMLARGELSSRTEYLFDPVLGARAAVLWLRALVNKWTTDDWPGGYGTFARRAINDGRALDDDQLFDLVTVSYNRGYLRVHDLVARYGPRWTSHLAELGADGAEAADYLERVRAYARLFTAAAAPPPPPDGTGH